MLKLVFLPGFAFGSSCCSTTLPRRQPPVTSWHAPSPQLQLTPLSSAMSPDPALRHPQPGAAHGPPASGVRSSSPDCPDQQSSVGPCSRPSQDTSKEPGQHLDSSVSHTSLISSGTSCCSDLLTNLQVYFSTSVTAPKFPTQALTTSHLLKVSLTQAGL